MQLEGEEGVVTTDDQSGQVVAQLVEAGEPAPGGKYLLSNNFTLALHYCIKVDKSQKFEIFSGNLIVWGKVRGVGICLNLRNLKYEYAVFRLFYSQKIL